MKNEQSAFRSVRYRWKVCTLQENGVQVRGFIGFCWLEKVERGLSTLLETALWT